MTPTHRLRGRVAWLVGRASLHAQRLIQDGSRGTNCASRTTGCSPPWPTWARRPRARWPTGSASTAATWSRCSTSWRPAAWSCGRRTRPTAAARSCSSPRPARQLLAGLDELVFAADDELLAGLSADRSGRPWSPAATDAAAGREWRRPVPGMKHRHRASGGCGMDVVIGIDTGTTATKGIAAGLDGVLRAHTSVYYPLAVPGAGTGRARPGSAAGRRPQGAGRRGGPVPGAAATGSSRSA